MIYTNKYIIQTDIKDFTLKSSLLSSEDLQKLLSIHDKYIQEAKLYGGKILKNLGDGYLIYFDFPDQSIIFLNELFKKLDIYNKQTTDELFKIKIRAAGVKGEFKKIKTLTGLDYASKDINLLNRILNLVPAGMIYIEKKFFDDLKNKNNFFPIGEAFFKGINTNIEIFGTILSSETKEKFKKTIEINFINNLKQELEGDKFKLNSIIKEIDDFIFKISAVGAIIITSPIPFIDLNTIFLLQIYMFFFIGNKYNVKYDLESMYSIILTFLSSLGFLYMKDWIKIWLFKIGLPGIGGYIQMPLAFGMLYGFGKLINFYFYKKTMQEKLSINDIKNYFIKREKDGIFLAKQKKKEIIKIGKYYKSEILEKIQNIREKLKEIKN